MLRGGLAFLQFCRAWLLFFIWSVLGFWALSFRRWLVIGGLRLDAKFEFGLVWGWKFLSLCSLKIKFRLVWGDILGFLWVFWGVTFELNRFEVEHELWLIGFRFFLLYFFYFFSAGRWLEIEKILFRSCFFSRWLALKLEFSGPWEFLSIIFEFRIALERKYAEWFWRFLLILALFDHF